MEFSIINFFIIIKELIESYFGMIKMSYWNKINYPTIKQQVTPLVNKTKAELKETAAFYKGNARQGWKIGSDIAQNKNKNSVTSFIIKTSKAIAKTRIRNKDIAPILGAALFFPIPIFGTWAVGFALGKAANPMLTKFWKAIKAGINKLHIK